MFHVLYIIINISRPRKRIKKMGNVMQPLKPQLHCHDFGHDGATTHPDLSCRDASA